MKVLILDDEILAVSLIQKHVDWQSIGVHDVYTAFTVADAQTIMRKYPIDLIICDIELPQHNGLEFLTWVRQFDPSVPSIILTAYPRFNYAQEAISLGVKKFLVKPASFDELAAAIKETLGTRPRAANQQGEGQQPERKRLIYLGLMIGDIFPTGDEIRATAECLSLTPKALEPGALIYFRFFGNATNAMVQDMKQLGEKLLRDLTALIVWDDLYMIVQKERTAQELDEMLATLLGEMKKLHPGCRVAAYYHRHVKLSTLYERAYQLREMGSWPSMPDICNAETFMRESIGVEAESGAAWQAAEAVMAYIHVHYAEPIGRTEIEKALHLNADYINRVFKGVTGYSLMQYLQYYRVLAAKRLMNKTRLSVAEVSTRVGFDNTSYFSKVFKKWMKVSPNEYLDGLEPQKNI